MIKEGENVPVLELSREWPCPLELSREWLCLGALEFGCASVVTNVVAREWFRLWDGGVEMLPEITTDLGLPLLGAGAGDGEALRAKGLLRTDMVSSECRRGCHAE